MFFQIKNETLEEMKFEQIDAGLETVGFLDLAEFEQCYPQLNFNPSCLEECKNLQVFRGSKIEVYDEFDYCFLRTMDTASLKIASDRIALFMKKNLLICIELKDEDKHLSKHFQEIIAGNIHHITLEKILYAILLDFISNTNEALSHMEKHILQLEERLFDGKETGDINREAFQIKRRLFACQTYYEELMDIGLALTENANHIFHHDNMRYLTVFTEKAERVCHNTEHLLERMVHLQEAYDAALDLNLNRIMKVFTVVTTIFLPLTLIVGWYGMNFKNIRELNWAYGYFFVILLSLLVVLFSIIFFKRKKWL